RNLSTIPPRTWCRSWRERAAEAVASTAPIAPPTPAGPTRAPPRRPLQQRRGVPHPPHILPRFAIFVVGRHPKGPTLPPPGPGAAMGVDVGKDWLLRSATRSQVFP